MRVFAITAQGQRFARSTRNPDTPGWRIIHFLDKRTQASIEDIAEFTGLDKGTAMVALRNLKANGLVMEVGRDRLVEISDERGME